MSSLKPSVFRSGDLVVLRIVFRSDKSGHDYYVLSFRCGEEAMGILSTSAGRINADGEVEAKDSRVEVYLPYCSTGSVECMVGYYSQNELKDHESLVSNFDSNQEVRSVDVSFPTVGTVPGSFNKKLHDFLGALGRRHSPWKAKISCPDDLIIKFSSLGKSATMVSFGESSSQLLVSDYVFQIDPGVTVLNIPREILRQKYSYYSPDSRLGLFELVRPDFMASSDVYYKALISNELLVSDLRPK